MIRTPRRDDENEVKELWQWIGWWMKELGFTPETLARLVRLSPDSIKKGIGGGYVPVRHALHYFVVAFGLMSGRTETYVKAVDSLSYDVLKGLLKPPSAQTPGEKLHYLYKF